MRTLIRAGIEQLVYDRGFPPDTLSDEQYEIIEHTAQQVYDEAKRMANKLLATPEETATGYINICLHCLLPRTKREGA